MFNDNENARNIVDPSQLSLPQIAAAVVAGELRLIDAEAELRRRPPAGESDLPRRPRPRPGNGTMPSAPGSRRTLAADVMRALVESKRELRQATRQLARLAQRFDELSQLAAGLQPAPTPRVTAPPPLFRRASSGGSERGEPLPLEECEREDQPPHHVAA